MVFKDSDESDDDDEIFDDFLRSAASGIGIAIGTLSDAIARWSKLARSKWQTNLKLRLKYARGNRSGGWLGEWVTRR